MKLYYTTTRFLPESQPFMFNCFMSYDEAVENAHTMLKHCAVNFIDVVDQETEKTFITLHRLNEKKIHGKTEGVRHTDFHKSTPLTS